MIDYFLMSKIDRFDGWNVINRKGKNMRPLRQPIHGLEGSGCDRVKFLEEELERQIREKEWMATLVEIYSHAVLKFCTNDQYQTVNDEINIAYDEFKGKTDGHV